MSNDELGQVDGVLLLLRELSPRLMGFDVSGFGESDLEVVLSEVRATQRRLDGLVTRIGVRCNQLAAEGTSRPAEEALRGDGKIGARQARRESARAEAAERVEGLGEAASAGETTGEHVDSIARHTAKLSDEQRASFNFGDLVERAKRMLPEAFDRHVKRCVDSAMADGGLGDTKAKQAASEFRHWFDHSTGMGRFSGSLDPERYEMLTTAIERRVTSIAASSEEAVTKNKNLAAQALIELVSQTASSNSGGRTMASVLVVVDHETAINGSHRDSLRQTEGGQDIAAESISRLCCDAVIRRVTLDPSGVPINVG
ncbi:MAG: hypothetical protein ACRBK7_26175, partial [Acidimicrobiales bacterium]